MNYSSLKLRALILLLVFSLFGCKKKVNNNPFGNLEIATADVAHDGAIEHYRFYYDNFHNVDSVSIIGDGTATGSSGHLKYQYFGSSWSITDENNFSFDVYANTSGMILKVLVADTLNYVYENNELSVVNRYAPSPLPPYYTITPTYYHWAGGDVTSIVTGAQTQTLTYDNSKNGQPGDPLRISDFLSYGKSIVRTSHLPAVMANGGGQSVRFFYGFDGEGRISSLVAASVDSTLSTYDTVFYSYTYY